MRIDSLTISGTNAEEFILLSEFDKKNLEINEPISIKLRFSPVSTGQKRANLNIFSGRNVFRVKIFAMAVKPMISLRENEADFKNVNLLSRKDSIINVFKNVSDEIIRIDSITRLFELPHFEIEDPVDLSV